MHDGTSGPQAEPPTGASVRIEPAGVTVEMLPGETVMQAAARAGFYWPTICGGFAECGVCRCDVVEGGARTVPARESEERFLNRLGARREAGHIRLACRLQVDGGLVTVRKPGVRPR